MANTGNIRLHCHKKLNLKPKKYNPTHFFEYFKECYKMDFKEYVIDNVLSRKHTFKWFDDKKETLVSSSLPIIPYTNSKAKELEKELELYQLEKKLYYGCFFLLGTNENALGKDKRICAPLLLFPATLKRIDEEYFLEIDRSAFSINRFVISQMDFKSNNSKETFLNELNNRVANDPENLLSIAKLFQSHINNIDTSDVLMFPNIWSSSKIKDYLSEGEFLSKNYKIVPGAGTVVVNKSESSLRVINDLETLEKKGQFNDSLNQLFYPNQSENDFDFSYYQSRLNSAQFEALKNAQKYPNSLIIGPPGTGKSYTITSIVADAISREQSVLVVSKTKSAVEVLRQMLEEDFDLKEFLVHTSSPQFKSSLRAKIRRRLSGVTNVYARKSNDDEIRKSFSKLSKMEEEFSEMVENELRLSELEFGEELSLVDKWKRFFLRFKSLNYQKFWRNFNQIEKELNELERKAKLHAKRKIQNSIIENSSKFRADISAFSDVLESNNFSQYKSLSNSTNYQNILKIFPIWLVNLSDLNAVLPLENDLFDLVILDEATQCDIATALPAIARAKRVVVVGDPNQLRHYSFVAKKKQNELLDKLGLPHETIFDYRNKSILDLYLSKIEKQEQVTFLREHFRSSPSIIGFSNEQFYAGQLEILKSTPEHILQNAVEIVECSGIRNEKGVNEIEANLLLSRLDGLISKYNEENKPPSLGIMAMFNDQAIYLRSAIKKKYDIKTIRRYQILVGTPYQFQGSERDIVLISFGISDDCHFSAINYLNKPEVLNVAVSRAKSKQIIFKSVNTELLNHDSILRKFFEYVSDYNYYNHISAEKDNFQQELFEELQKMGCENVYCSYPLAGKILDILVTQDGQHYFIDLIGYPGQFLEAFSLERYRTLARTGVQTLPIHYSAWVNDKPYILNKLKHFFGLDTYGKAIKLPDF